jgi:PAS domain S-box-containing protein
MPEPTRDPSRSAPAPGPDGPGLPNALYASLFQAAPNPYLILDPTLRIIEVNQAYLVATMSRRDALIGTPMFEAFPDNPDDEAATGVGNLRASLERVLASGRPDEMPVQKYDIRRPDGSFEVRYWKPLNTPIFDADGRLAAILHWVEDVTSLAALEQQSQARLEEADALRSLNARIERLVDRRTRELAHQKRFAESIVQNVPAGVAYLDRTLVFRVVNPAYAAFVHQTPDEVVGRYVFDVFRGTEEALMPLFRQVLDTGRPHVDTSFPLNFVGADGEARTTYWDFGYYPAAVGENGETEGVLILATEVSDRVRREADRQAFQRERIVALEQADKLKDEFLSILSHELRSPINAMIGFGTILEDEISGPLNASQHKAVKRILTSAETQLALIEDLLVVSRVQAGRFSVTLEPTDFSAVVATALENLAPGTKKRLTIVNDVPADLPLVPGDVQRLGQVVTNLVGNAVKFTPEGGTITVRARLAGDRLRVEVTDTGIGISKEDQTKLFKRFGQIDAAREAAHHGTGLGLSIVKAIVDAHGGEAGVESEPGHGSTFWFTLPLAGPAAPATD